MSLTIIAKKIEQVDMKRLDFLLTSETLTKKTRTTLNAYKKRIKNKDVNGNIGSITVIYEHTENSVDNEGRMFAQGAAAQKLPRNERNFLLAPLYVDIDMENAMFFALHNLFIKLTNEPCPEIERYIEKRSEMLSFTGYTKEKAIAMINSQKLFDNTPDFFARMHDKVYNELLPLLKDLYSELWENTEIRKGSDNPHGTFISLVCQLVENEELQCMDKFLLSRGFHPDIWEFDGLKCRKNAFITEELLDQCCKHVVKCLGYRMRLHLKPMETTYVYEESEEEEEDLEDVNVPSPGDEARLVDAVYEILLFDTLHQKQIAEMYTLLSPGKIIKDSGGGVWSTGSDGFWIPYDDASDLHLQIYNTIESFLDLWKGFMMSQFNDEMRKKFRETIWMMLKNLGTRAYAKSVAANVVDLVLPTSNAADLFLSNPHLFAFKDGVYDLIKGEFRPVIPGDYKLPGTGYNYPRDTDTSLCKIIQDEILDFYESIFPPSEESTFSQMASFRFQTVVSSLYGKHLVEVFFMLIGEGRNGKGVEDVLIRIAFGGYYFALDKKNLITSSADVDRPNAQLKKLFNKQYISFSEPAKKDVLSSDIMKILTGNDYITVRGLYDKNPLSFPVTGNINGMSNHVAKMDEIQVSMVDRTINIEYPYHFVENPDAERPNEKLMDKSLKTKFATPEYRDAFILLLLDYFKIWFVKDGEVKIEFEYPDDVKTFTLMNLAKSLSFNKWFFKRVVVTGHPNDRFKRSDLWKAYVSDNSPNTIQQSEFNKEMKDVFKLHKFTDDGFCYLAMRPRTEEDDELESAVY